MSFLAGFGAGAMGTAAKNISQRKDEAQLYFNEQMKIARERAHEYRTKGAEKFKTSLQVANQMKAAGVPDDVIMRIANQNPDDLPQFYEHVQRLKLDGVPTDNPDFYYELFNIDKEFNAGNENITSLLQKIHMPLAANIKADPEGFKLDPRGNIWATMMGYNAMERANERLDTTVVADGMTASDFIHSNPNNYNQPLGDTTIGLDASFAGDAIRTAKEGDGLNFSQQLQVMTTFGKWTEEELLPLQGVDMSPEQRLAEAKKRAAIRMRDWEPLTLGIPEIARWLPSETPEEDIITSPLPSTGETSPPPEKPSEPATAGGASAATPPPENTTPLPQQLPNGATLIRDVGDGTSEWMLNGKEVRVRNEEVFTMIGSATTGIPAHVPSEKPTMQAKPEPGWLERQGSEYD